MGKCVFCKSTANVSRISSIMAVYLFSCESCGEYKMSDIATESLREKIFMEQEIEDMRKFLSKANSRGEVSFLTNNKNINEGNAKEERVSKPEGIYCDGELVIILN